MRRTIPILLFSTLLLFIFTGLATAASIDVVVDTPSSGHNPFYIKSKVAPYIENGRTMVPLRAVSESLGFKVDWQASNSQITVSNGQRQIIMQVNSAQASIDGKAVELETPPKLLGNNTFLPLRFVSENMGYCVYFSKARSNANILATIYITSYNLVKDEEIAAAPIDKRNYYELPAKGDQKPQILLKDKGTTLCGLCLGDPVSKVLDLYGIPVEPVRRTDNYRDNWSGTLTYLGSFIPQGKECAGPLMVIECRSGLVTSVKIINS